MARAVNSGSENAREPAWVRDVLALLSKHAVPLDQAEGERTRSFFDAERLVACGRECGRPLINEEGHPFDARDLDKALENWWWANEDTVLRPARYPHARDMRRLWGLVEHVGDAPRELLEPLLTGPGLPFETLPTLREGAPRIFLAHSGLDCHFCGRLRLHLANLGVHGWLAEAELRPGEHICDVIREHLERADALLIALTVNSLSAPWVFTESQTWREWRGERPIVVADGADLAVLQLLEVWRQNSDQRARKQALEKAQALLSPEMPESRRGKFVDTAGLLLDQLWPHDQRDPEAIVRLAFFPAAPLAWPDDEPWLSMEEAAGELLRGRVS